MSNIQYDMPCGQCQGSAISSEDEELTCETCEGYGHLLTTAGYKLIEFLKRRGVSISMSPQAENELSSMLEKG